MADKDAKQYGKDTNKVDGRIIVGLIVLVLIVIFVMQNRQDVELTLFVFDFTTPLWIGLLVTVLLSMGVGFLLGRGRYKG